MSELKCNANYEENDNQPLNDNPSLNARFEDDISGLFLDIDEAIHISAQVEDMFSSHDPDS